MLINKLIKQLFNKKISPKISYLFLYYRMIVIITKRFERFKTLIDNFLRALEIT